MADAGGYTDGEDAPNKDKPTAAKLLSFLGVPNLATTLTEEQLTEISAKAIDGYKIDDASREEWKKKNEEGLKLAALFVDGPKDSPFPGAANVKAPLITTAALQFNSRAYPAIIKDERVAKAKVNGHDPDGKKAQRAARVSEHMSWQLTSEMPEWEEDTDRLTLLLAITGAVFRKRYLDPTLGRQCSRLITADRFVYNYKARSVEDCPRLSEELPLYPYEIQERIRDGRFIDFDYGDAPSDPDNGGRSDVDAPHLFIEQHRLLDLDEDGYGEPYIVTVHLESKKVCRIVCNFDKDSVRVTPDGKIAAIRRNDYYTKYVFFQSPDGGAYGMGLGMLMGSTTEVVNTLLNQMLDAGTLANTQGGFISAAAGIREKVFRFSRGEFKVVNTGSVPISQAVLPVKFDGPDETLFKLLGLLMEFAKDISSTKDVLTGDTGGKVMAPTTTLALIEQGMKVFNAIFKRVHRAIKHELDMHAKLNYDNLSPEAYNQFFDGPEQYDPKADYDMKTMDVTPVSDPSISTQMQAMAQAQVISEIAGEKPYFDHQEVDRRALEAAGIPDIDKLFAKPAPPDPLLEAMGKLEMQDKVASIKQKLAAALKSIADAEAAEAGSQVALYDTYLNALSTEHGMETQQNAQIAGGPGGLPGMAPQSGDAMGAGPPQGAGLGDGSTGAGPALEQPASPVAPVGGDAGGAGAQQGAM